MRHPNHSRTKIVLLAALLLGLGSRAIPATVTADITAVADAYIRNGTHANTNYGSASPLTVKYNTNPDFQRIAYLQFDLAGYNRGDLDGATLRLYARNADDSTTVSLKIYGLENDTWDEATMTWLTGSPNHEMLTTTVNQSGGTATLLGTISVTDTLQYYELDVTGFVGSQLTENRLASFIAVQEAGPGKTIFIDSMEATANRPALRLSYSDATVAVAASADTYARNGSHTSANHGTSTELIVSGGGTDNGRIAYLKFPLTGLTDPWVRKATVRLHAKSRSGGAHLTRLHAITDESWSETALNWTNSVGHYSDPGVTVLTNKTPTGTFVGSQVFTTSAYYYELDITDAINAKLNAGADNIHVMASSIGGGALVNFASRNSAYPPEILADGTSYLATDDTYIENGASAGTDFSTHTHLRVSGSSTSGRISYLKFDLSSIATVPGQPAVNSAKLRLYVYGYFSTANEVQFHLITGPWADTWSEAGTNTWLSGTPNHDTNPNAYVITDVKRDLFSQMARKIDATSTTYDFDVTDYVNAQLIKGKSVSSFLLAIDDTSGDQIAFASREDGTNPPQLVVERNLALGNLALMSDSTVTSSGLTFTYGAYGLMPNLTASGNPVLVTSNGWQYATYYNSNRHVCVARRQLPSGTWQEIELTDYDYRSLDTHNAASLGICETDGTIHLAFDHHKNDLRYRRSVTGVTTSPGTITWTAAAVFSTPTTSQLISGQTVTKFTYPYFVAQPSGKLLLRYRFNSPGNGDGMLYEYDGSTGTWANLGQYDDRDGTTTTGTRSSYPDGLVYDASGNLHTSWTWREGATKKNHDVLYAYSTDHGRTWRDSAGNQRGSIGTDFLEVDDPGLVVRSVAENREMANTGSLTVDPSGRVHIMSRYNPATTPKLEDLGQVRYHHNWRSTGGSWSQVELPSYKGSRGRLLADDDAVYLVWGNRDYGTCNVARATSAKNYTDWELIHVQAGPGLGYGGETPSVDAPRFLNEGVISILQQVVPAVWGDATEVRAIDLRVY